MQKETIHMRSHLKLSVLFTLYLTLCLLFLFSTSASAYIDPSTTTFVIQAVAGVAIAVGAAVVVYWRKAKKKVMNKLGMDENAKKEVESDDIRVTGDETPKE